MTVIVYGPPACGKTRNARKLARHFGVKKIVDNWWPAEHALTPGALHLTNEHPENVTAKAYAYASIRLPQNEASDAVFVGPRFKPNPYTSGGVA